MVLYIHGFASSGKGHKGRVILKYFGEKAMVPSLPYIPDLALDTLRQITEHTLRSKESLFLIGSSLGGFYATYLSETYDLPAVLINPSVEPWKTLASHTGMVTNFFDLCSFEWCERHLKQLQRAHISTISKPDNFLLLLQKGDETLDYMVAKKWFEGAKMVVEDGGSHAFESFESHLKDIETFFNSKEKRWS